MRLAGGRRYLGVGEERSFKLVSEYLHVEWVQLLPIRSFLGAQHPFFA